MILTKPEYPPIAGVDDFNVAVLDGKVHGVT
jgi:hypothetical protein